MEYFRVCCSSNCSNEWYCTGKCKVSGKRDNICFCLSCILNRKYVRDMGIVKFRERRLSRVPTNILQLLQTCYPENCTKDKILISILKGEVKC